MFNIIQGIGKKVVRVGNDNSHLSGLVQVSFRVVANSGQRPGHREWAGGENTSYGNFSKTNKVMLSVCFFIALG